MREMDFRHGHLAPSASGLPERLWQHSGSEVNASKMSSPQQKINTQQRLETHAESHKFSSQHLHGLTGNLQNWAFSPWTSTSFLSGNVENSPARKLADFVSA